MIKMDVKKGVYFEGSRVWFSQCDQYGVDSIFKTNQYHSCLFYAMHPQEWARNCVWMMLDDVLINHQYNRR